MSHALNTNEINRKVRVWDRRHFIGGSDARIIMGSDDPALLQLWREKRGEAQPEDLSGNLPARLGVVTETLNRHWFERNTGQVVTGVQRRIRHPVIRFLAATLDGVVESTGAVFESKFMLPWHFSEEGAAQKYIAQLQHNMWVTNASTAVLSIITGGGKWVELIIPADSLYQHLLLKAEKKFWRCVQSGEPPRLFLSKPPKVRIEAVRIVDMGTSNAWAQFAAPLRLELSGFVGSHVAPALTTASIVGWLHLFVTRAEC
jgi:predicted phage-related endonuclease